MLTEVTAGPHTLRGISVGGVYTSIAATELGLLFDVGVAARTLASYDTWLLSHAHADHIGAIAAQLGIRGLQNHGAPPTVIMPAEIEADVHQALAALSRLQRFPLEIRAVGLRPGDCVAVGSQRKVTAVKTFHPVPALGYVVSETVQKLRPQFAGVPGPDIAALRKSGHPITSPQTRHLFAYATDTLATVLDHAPVLLQAETLVLEATFLDARKSRDTAHAGCHIHLDDLIDRQAALVGAPMQHLVLMHVSQLYQPAEVPKILQARLAPELFTKVVPFAPKSGPWFG